MPTAPRGRADYYAPGDWNATCFRCGSKYKASQLVKYWQGFYVCPACWETRHPQDFVRSVPDNQTPPWAQPDDEVFVDFCTPNGLTAIAGFAVAGCAIAGYISPAFDPNVTNEML